jgi:hypothetical protein
MARKVNNNDVLRSIQDIWANPATAHPDSWENLDCRVDNLVRAMRPGFRFPVHECEDIKQSVMETFLSLPQKLKEPPQSVSLVSTMIKRRFVDGCRSRKPMEDWSELGNRYIANTETPDDHLRSKECVTEVITGVRKVLESFVGTSPKRLRTLKELVVYSAVFLEGCKQSTGSMSKEEIVKRGWSVVQSGLPQDERSAFEALLELKPDTLYKKLNRLQKSLVLEASKCPMENPFLQVAMTRLLMVRSEALKGGRNKGDTQVPAVEVILETLAQIEKAGFATDSCTTWLEVLR